MNPYARFSASAALTLAIWGPHAVGSIRSNSVDLAHSAGRFLVIFIASRVAMRAVSNLLHSYRESSKFDVRTAIEADPVLEQRRRPSNTPEVIGDRRRPNRAGEATQETPYIDALPGDAG